LFNPSGVSSGCNDIPLSLFSFALRGATLPRHDVLFALPGGARFKISSALLCARRAKTGEQAGAGGGATTKGPRSIFYFPSTFCQEGCIRNKFNEKAEAVK